jgi:hypothetical protein
LLNADQLNADRLSESPKGQGAKRCSETLRQKDRADRNFWKDVGQHLNRSASQHFSFFADPLIS